MKPKLNPDQFRELSIVNSVLERFGNVRTLFDGVMMAGYHGSDTFRNTWHIFGYPQQLLFTNYFNMYLRGGIANACITKPVKKRWSSYPTVYDEPFEEDGKIIKGRKQTEFEIAVQRLVDEFDLWGVLKELDECQRIGLYGGILITAKETGSVSDLKGTPLMAQGYVNGLVSLSPCYESQIDMYGAERDDDKSSKRYGLPKSYTYKEGSTIEGSTFGCAMNVDTEIHWSRAFVFSEFARGNGIIGRPALMPVFNSLMDWYKIVGSSAEGMFKNAKQRLNMNITDQSLAAMMFSKSDNSGTQDEYSKMITEFERGFNNTLDTAGIEAKVLQASMSDPSSPAALAIQDICAGIGIPKTELIGFETGERSSTENANSWNVENQSWRATTGTKMVKRFLYHLVDVGVLPVPKNNRIMVDWPDISASSVEQRIDNAKNLAGLITALHTAGKEAAVDSVVRNMLPDVLDIDIEDDYSDLPGSGLKDAESEEE